MKHVALVTCSNFPALSPSDERLVEPLKKEKILTHAVAWDKKGVDWSLFDAIALRACWNYPTKYSQFMDWLTNLEHIRANVWNPINIMRWNIQKTYLFDLEKRGVSIIPTVVVNKQSKPSLHNEASDVIIKPVIGNMSQGIYRSPKNIERLLKTGDYLVQPFMPEVTNEGEYRFIFIGGELTHTILKTQKATSLVKPAPALTHQAADVLHTVETNLLYARVDGINRNGIFILMELELIEPILFFDMNQKAAAIFARALKNVV